MSRRRSRRRYERAYYDDPDYSYPPYRRRRGCLYRMKRFARTLFTTLLLLIGGSLLAALLVVLLVHLPQMIQAITGVLAFIRRYGPIALLVLVLVTGAFTILGIAYGIVRIIAGISTLLASASSARAKAHQEHAKVKLATLAQERETVKIAQQRENTQARRAQPVPVPQRSRLPTPGRARHITEQLTAHLWQLSQSQELPAAPARQTQQPISLAQEERRPRIPGMPQSSGPCLYRTYQHLIGPGQLAAGIRQDGKLRLGSWADYKIVLVLGDPVLAKRRR
jgi:hypothetical protein